MNVTLLDRWPRLLSRMISLAEYGRSLLSILAVGIRRRSQRVAPDCSPAFSLVVSLCLLQAELSASPVPYTGCNNLGTLKLQCPALQDPQLPPQRPGPGPAARPLHPPIAVMLRENCREAAQAAAEARDREWKQLRDDTIIPAVFRHF